MIRTLLLFSLCFAFTLAGDAQASNKAPDDLDVETMPFAQQATKIRTDLTQGDQYSEISQADRDQVLGLLARIESLLESVDNVDALPMQSRIELFNDQERINTILTGARADSRMICTRTQVTGSHRKQQVCMTVADRERRRERDREDAMLKQRQTPCMGLGAGCVGPGL
jgi:hypothetical protein